MAIDQELLDAAAGQKKGEDPSGWDDEEQDLSDPTRLDVGQQVDDIDPVVGDGTEDEAPPVETETETEREEVDAEALYEQDGGQEDEAEAQELWKAPFAREADDSPVADSSVAELRAELAALRQELAGRAQASDQDFAAERTKIEADIDELWVARKKQDLDGDTAGAIETDMAIRKAERALTRVDVREATEQQGAAMARTTEETRAEIARVRAQAALDETRQELLDVHPAFDRSSKAFDPAMEKEALRLYKAFYNAGDITASQALRDAVGYVTSAAKPARTGKQIDAERTETARRRNAAAAPKSGSPARKGVSSAKAGRNGPLPTPSKMSDRELRALTPAARAKLRGDIL